MGAARSVAANSSAPLPRAPKSGPARTTKVEATSHAALCVDDASDSGSSADVTALYDDVSSDSECDAGSTKQDTSNAEGGVQAFANRMLLEAMVGNQAALSSPFFIQAALIEDSGTPQVIATHGGQQVQRNDGRVMDNCPLVLGPANGPTGSQSALVVQSPVEMHDIGTVPYG